MDKLLQIKQNMYLLKMNLKNYRNLTQVFLSSKFFFNNDGAQLYLILQLLYYTSKRRDDTENVA